MDDGRVARGIEAESIQMELDKYGKPKNTIENFLCALRADERFAHVRFNELTHAPETAYDGAPRGWTDTDDAQAINYLENAYGLYSEKKYGHAMRVLHGERKYHPVRALVSGIKWDGVERINGFLSKWMLCDDVPYVRECSRLIFAGGIHRLYRPGCKFDDMIVLIGSKQGEGKSTLVRWLAMRDDFYADVKQFDGQQGIEELSGAWICEVGELLALTKSREVEAIKSFLTRQCDRCRHPYDHHVSDHPRQCVFIGTTNRRQFLTDKTGNRRFYPVEVHQTGYELFSREAECRADIAQCWAEARAKMDTPFMAAFADQSLSKTIRSLQESAVEDDWRVGVIDEYLRKKMPGERVFAQELRTYALYPKTENLRDDKRESVEIGIIMQDMAGWVREGKASRRHAYPKYGPQKCWIKEPDLVTTMDDDMPF